MGAESLRRVASLGRVHPDGSRTSHCPTWLSRPLAVRCGWKTLLMGWDRAYHSPPLSAVGQGPEDAHHRPWGQAVICELQPAAG